MKRIAKYSLLSPTLCALLAAAACGEPTDAADQGEQASAPALDDASDDRSNDDIGLNADGSDADGSDADAEDRTGASPSASVSPVGKPGADDQASGTPDTSGDVTQDATREPSEPGPREGSDAANDSDNADDATESEADSSNSDSDNPGSDDPNTTGGSDSDDPNTTNDSDDQDTTNDSDDQDTTSDPDSDNPDSDNPDAEDPDTTDTPDDERDTDPALNTGEYSAAAFEYETAQPLSWHPLGKERVNLLQLEETALVINGGAGGVLSDDGQHAHAESALSAALTPANTTAVWAGSGNLDDDGHAELVVINHDASQLHVVIGDNSEAGTLSTTLGFDIPNGGAAAGAVKAAIADFDGDGRDELAISAAGPSGWLRIYDDATGGFALLEESTLSQNQADVDLAAGNFDADDAKELAVLRIGKGTDNLGLTVLDDVNHELATLKDVPAAELLPDPGMGDEDSVWLSGGIVRAGNIDADGQTELYVLLSQLDAGDEGSGGLRVMGRVFDDVSGAMNVIATPQVSDLSYPTGSLERPYDAAFADMDGDGVAELYLLHLESSEPDFAWKLSQWNPSANTASWSSKASYTLLDDGYNPVSMGRMAVVDGDGLTGESIVVALKQSGSSFPVKTWRLDAQPVVVADDTRSSFAFRIGTGTVTAGDYPSASVPLLAGGDFDNDSLQVRYTGDNWLSLSSPRPIVVMAAPPIKAGISQNTSSAGTAFGNEVSHSQTASSEVSTSYSTTLSFETSTLTSLFGALGSLAGGSVSTTLENAFASTNTETTIESVGTSFSCAYSDDCIVFQGVLYTSYAYEVIQASDPSVLGKRMTVDVPVAIKTYKWTLPFYNDMLADGDVAIGAETLNHTAGDPTTYPNAATRDQLLAGVLGWKSNQVAVGQGQGSNSVTIDIAEESSHGGSDTITNEDSWGFAIAGAGYDSSVATSDTGAYEVGIGSTTSYQGTIGDIQNTIDYKDYAYDFGLFVYEFAHPQGPRFQVINYWTSNFGPGL